MEPGKPLAPPGHQIPAPANLCLYDNVAGAAERIYAVQVQQEALVQADAQSPPSYLSYVFLSSKKHIWRGAADRAEQSVGESS